MGVMKKRSYEKANLRSKKKRGGVLIFAYGSNLDVDQMFRRCPDAEVVGPAYLSSHRLDFCGHSAYWRGAVATVVRTNNGSCVPGALYRVNAWDLAYLDACEGHPSVYRRVPMKVVRENGRTVSAQVYVRECRGRGQPSVAYFRAIYKGYCLWGFHPNHLTRLVRIAL
jgi:cation transport regulator ChaC